MPEAGDKKDWKDILNSLDTRTKLLGLVCLIADVLFVAAIVKLDGVNVLWALLACLVVLCFTIYGIIRLELSAPRPPMVREELKYDAFVSIPMAAVSTEEDYQKYRNTALEAIKALKEACKCETVFCSAEAILTKRNFDLAQVSLEVDIKNVARSKCMVVIYDEKLVSSVFVEAGAAIALGKSVVVFAKHRDTLPFLLRESSQELAYAVHEYNEERDVATLIRRTGSALFPQRRSQ